MSATSRLPVLLRYVFHPLFALAFKSELASRQTVSSIQMARV